MGAGFLEDADGNSSSSRLIVIVVAFVIIGVWAYISIREMKPAVLPWEIVTMLFVCVLGKNATGYLQELRNNMLTKVDK